jgi:hypothetical protein
MVMYFMLENAFVKKSYLKSFLTRHAKLNFGELSAFVA